MKKLVLILLAVLAISFSAASVAFANVVNIVDEQTAEPRGKLDDASVVIKSNRYRTVRVLEYSVYNTTHYPYLKNETNARVKVLCHHEVKYNVYQENISTGVRHFLYSEYETNWTGYWRKEISEGVFTDWQVDPDCDNITEKTRERYSDLIFDFLEMII